MYYSKWGHSIVLSKKLKSTSEVKKKKWKKSIEEKKAISRPKVRFVECNPTTQIKETIKTLSETPKTISGKCLRSEIR